MDVPRVFSTVHAQVFTLPTTQITFLVGDLLNITWDVDSARFSLYEVCFTSIPLQSNVSNTNSYIWNATRDHYRESGCIFELEPLDDVDGNIDDDAYADAIIVCDGIDGDGNSCVVQCVCIKYYECIAWFNLRTKSWYRRGCIPRRSVGMFTRLPIHTLPAASDKQQEDATEQPDPIPKTDIKPPTTSTNQHISGTETFFSELSAQNYDENGNKKESVQRPINELMASPPRAESEKGYSLRL